MTTLSKLYTWVSFPPLPPASECMGEFNQILNLLNGGSSNRRGYVVFSDATLAPARFNQENAGTVAEFQVSGTTKASINNSGQIVSAISTGTAPFSITSTTKCTNVNADQIDGLEGSVFTRSDTGSQIKSTFTLAAAASGENLVFVLDANTLTVQRSSDSATIFTISSLNASTRVWNFPSTLNATVSQTPSASTDVINKTYFDANKSTWIPTGGGYAFNPAVNYIFYKWICPASSLYKITTLKGYIGNNASATGNSVVTFYQNNVSIGTLTWTSAETGTKTNNIADINLAGDDEIKAVVTTDGAHRDYFANAITEMQ